MLILGGISGAGITTFMAEYRPIFIAVTFGFLAMAFYMAYRPRPASSSTSKMMAFNKVMLWGVTAFAIAFLFFPKAATSFFTPSDVISSDMERTVIRIEGMT